MPGDGSQPTNPQATGPQGVQPRAGQDGTARRRRWVLLGVGALLLFGLWLLLRPGPDPATPTRAGERVVAGSARAFDNCRECHRSLDLGIATGRAMKGLLFTHDKHFGSGVSDCASCHVAAPHAASATGKSSLTVKPDHDRCFACHGKGVSDVRRAGPVLAAGRCDTCHDAGSLPKPSSHRTKAWLSDTHGRVALDRPGKRSCLTCHSKKDCTSCHGLAMPHPTGFSGSTHASVASASDGRVCVRCHSGGASFCEACHHPMKPPSVSMTEFHHDYMEEGGIGACTRCHNPSSFCTRCHGREGD
jgi:hypothetical protein